MRRVFEYLHIAFHQRGARAYRAMDGIVWTLITLSLLNLSIELASGPALQDTLRQIDQVFLSLFAIELLLRVLSYRPPQLDIFHHKAARRLMGQIGGRLRFCTHPLLLIDILALLAIYPPLRMLRALRLLRLMRPLPLFRYSRPFLSLLRALQDNALLYVSALALLLLTVTAAGITLYLSERGALGTRVESIGDGLWWALVTITTVGYGDVTPVTTVGRVISGVLMVMGMFTLALFAGIVGSTLVSVVLQLRQDQFRMSQHVNHVIVCGYDKRARLLLDALRAEMLQLDREVLIFAQGERPKDLPPDFGWISGDPSRESELAKAKIAEADSTIIVGSRSCEPQQADATTILVLFTLRAFMAAHPDTPRRKKPLYIVAEILDSENVAHAYAAGADEVAASAFPQPARLGLGDDKRRHRWRPQPLHWSQPAEVHHHLC
ncbi:MAG: ion transporter [Deltaproteobacteria bacterium]|nr:ion transporter [Deltaproteobacteria bacterium]